MLRSLRHVVLFALTLFAAISLGGPALADDATAAAPAAAPAATTADAPAAQAAPAAMPAPAAAPRKAAPAEARMHLTTTERKAIQVALNTHGAKLKVDGMLGGRSKAAIKQFQSSNGLTVTGQPDAATLEKLGVK